MPGRGTIQRRSNRETPPAQRIDSRTGSYLYPRFRRDHCTTTRICKLSVDSGFALVHPSVELELSFLLVHVTTSQQLSLMASSSRRRIVSEEPDDVASGEFTSVSQPAQPLIGIPQKWTCRSR